MRVIDGTCLPLRGDRITVPAHDAQPLYVVGLRNGRLLAPFGIAASADGTLFTESQRDETCLRHFYFDTTNLFTDAGRRHHAEQIDAPAQRRPGRCVSLLYELGENWYHWLIENLGRVFVAHQIPNQASLRYIVRPDLTAAQLETLDRLGIGAARRIVYDQTLWQCDELWLPSFPSTRGSIYEPYHRLLAETLVAQNHGVKGAGARRLYLSRAGAGRRLLENDDDIAAALAPFGFEVADFGRASLSEQIAAFQGADSIVAPHGAALSNILFMRPNSFVVELLPRRPSGIVDTIFYGLAVASRCRYIGIVGTQLAHEQGDFRVLPEIVAGLVERIVRQSVG